MPAINFQRTYQLGADFERIKERAIQLLGKYLLYPGLITFKDLEKSVTFTSEKLIPATSSNRPRVMLLFSNPHPHSVHQGMFLSPNTRGRENSFWSIMRDAGWIVITKEHNHPKQLADICLEGQYQGPFELIFYCYFAFPTLYPEDIRKIFGEVFFRQTIEAEARNEFLNTIQETPIKAVITFNKTIFNLIAHDPIEHYINHINEGALIKSHLRRAERTIPLFLTYPTGWHYHRQFRLLRKNNLEMIQIAIDGGQ